MLLVQELLLTNYIPFLEIGVGTQLHLGIWHAGLPSLLLHIQACGVSVFGKAHNQVVCFSPDRYRYQIHWESCI